MLVFSKQGFHVPRELSHLSDYSSHALHSLYPFLPAHADDVHDVHMALFTGDHHPPPPKRGVHGHESPHQTAMHHYHDDIKHNVSHDPTHPSHLQHVFDPQHMDRKHQVRCFVCLGSAGNVLDARFSFFLLLFTCLLPPVSRSTRGII